MIAWLCNLRDGYEAAGTVGTVWWQQWIHDSAFDDPPRLQAALFDARSRIVDLAVDLHPTYTRQQVMVDVVTRTARAAELADLFAEHKSEPLVEAGTLWRNLGGIVCHWTPPHLRRGVYQLAELDALHDFGGIGDLWRASPERERLAAGPQGRPDVTNGPPVGTEGPSQGS